MIIHTIVSMVFLTSLGIAAYNKRKLNNNRTFLMFLALSILQIAGGCWYGLWAHSIIGCYVLGFSQLTLVYLILYRLVRDRYYLIYKREPELTRNATRLVDVVLTLLLSACTILIPYLLTSYFCNRLIAFT